MKKVNLFQARSTFHNVTINNDHAGGITLNNSIAINNIMTMTKGIIYATDAQSAIGEAEIALTDPSNNMVVFNDNAYAKDFSYQSHVDGIVKKIGNCSNSTWCLQTDIESDEVFKFPVGDSSIMSKIEVETNAGDTGILYCQHWYHDPDFGEYDKTSLGTGINHVGYREYWRIEKENTTASAYVYIQWEASRSGGIDDASKLRVIHWNGSEWEDKGGNNLAYLGSMDSGFVRTNARQASFSPFTIGSATSANALQMTGGNMNPLPISLMNFDVAQVGNTVEFAWETHSEINNSHYIIEKSADGMKYEPLMQITSDNSIVGSSYNAVWT